MRIIFMGTPEFSVSTLDALIEAGHQVIAVVTQPDKPRGRGKEMQMTPVKERALSYQIPVFQPQKVRDPEFISILKDMNPDVMAVVAFGQILPQDILDIPVYGCINVHASLLPRYRGAAPIQYAVINGDAESGITIMMMDLKMDTGDILKQAKVTLEQEETGGSLHDKLSRMGGTLLVETLKEIESEKGTRIPQPEQGVSYVGKLEKNMGNIDWNQDAVSIERLIRGLNPWPSAYTMWAGKTLKLWKADVTNENHSGVPGQVVESGKDSFTIKTGQGALIIREVQLQGKKRMDTPSFLRGYQMEIGTVFERS